MSGFVYAIALDDKVKIGYATNVRKRLQTLQTAAPGQLEILKTWAADEHVERNIHAQFGHLRVHGEWFSRCPEIDALVAGDLPEHLLSRAVREDFECLPVARRLRDAMRAENLTRKQLAARLGKTEEAVKKMLSGVGLTQFQKLAELCRVLNTTPNDLLGFQPSPQPENAK